MCIRPYFLRLASPHNQIYIYIYIFVRVFAKEEGRGGRTKSIHGSI